MKVKNRIIWFGKIFRWTLGGAFLGAGLYARYDWSTLFFGAVLFFTGFLRPKCCIDRTDGAC